MAVCKLVKGMKYRCLARYTFPHRLRTESCHLGHTFRELRGQNDPMLKCAPPPLSPLFSRRPSSSVVCSHDTTEANTYTMMLFSPDEDHLFVSSAVKISLWFPSRLLCTVCFFCVSCVFGRRVRSTTPGPCRCGHELWNDLLGKGEDGNLPG